MANPTKSSYHIGYDEHDVICEGVVVNGSKVLSDQQTLVADTGAITTVGSNTGTAGAGLSLIGDTTAVDQAANLMNDLVALQEDIAALRVTLLATLDVLEAHGLMADA